MIKKLSDTIAQARRARAFDQTFKNVFDRPTLHSMRKWSTQRLHNEIGNGNLDPALKSMAQSILKSREAWYGPGRWSLIISGLALIVSAVAAYIAYGNRPQARGADTAAEAPPQG